MASPLSSDEPEVLAAAAGGLDPSAGQRGGEAGRPARVATDRAGVQDLDGSEPGADHVALEAGADHLDLGELGHGGVVPGAGQSLASATADIEARISPYAVSAAPCSASFLDRPVPLP